jgi:hypothetical protein
MSKKMTKNPLNGRGTAMLAAPPLIFSVAEAAFHANPVVGVALGALGGYIAYQHFDDWHGAVENVKAGTVRDYVPRNEPEKIAVLPKKPEGIVLGHDKLGKPVTRELERLKNILILGLPGQGKSSLACWLLSQMVVNCDARLIIIDRHARDDESLSAMLAPFEKRFLCPPAYRFEDMQNSIEAAVEILTNRMEGNDADRRPVVFVVDEFTDLMRSKKIDGLTDAVEGFNAMGRKYGCFSLCIGQLVNASRTGGTEIRSLFATKMLLGMEKSQAQMLVSVDVAVQVERLVTGECIVKGEGKEEPFKIKFPKKSQKYYKEQARSLVALEPYGEADGSDFDGDEVLRNTSSQTPPRRAQNAIPDDEALRRTSSEAEAVRMLTKRIKGGESPYSICKSLGLPISGQTFMDAKQALNALKEAE